MRTEWRFESNLSNVLNAMQDKRKTALETIGQFVEGEAVLRCPVGQYDDGRVGGNLRNSIKNVVAEDNVTVGTDVEYSGYVEKGTSRQKAQPYLTPAIEDNTSSIEQIVRQVYGSIS